MKTTIFFAVILTLLASCSVSRYDPARKFGHDQLDRDYTLFRSALEEAHPSLYWYTPKDSVDHFFEAGRRMLKDSMTEIKFRNVLSYVIEKIRCGHTSVRPSKAAAGYFNSRAPSFPLFVKLWPDTSVVTLNINRRDTSVKRGVVLESIDRMPMELIIDSFFSHLPSDGYNLTHKYQTLSNGGNFRNMYANIFGLKGRVPVTYIDSTGTVRSSTVGLYFPPADSTRPTVRAPKLSKRERKKLEREAMRSLKIDTAESAAFLEVNTFTKRYELRSFFRNSFKKIEELKIKNLVVDMRANGGGSVTLSNLLTKYIAAAPFKIADSLYAVKRSSRYGKYREHRILNWLFLQFFTRKRSDGNYHFTLYEGKEFKPKSRYHFDGTTYILTGGNTFSAATLFTKALADQENVIVVGEETGGGGYGNTAWLIPDVTLPNTGVRFRLPLFRLVIDKNATKGRGVMPEVEALPSVNAIRKGEDYKMEKVREMIKVKSR